MSTKLEQVAVRMPPELREKLQQAADRDQRPLSSLIRKILADGVKSPQSGVAA